MHLASWNSAISFTRIGPLPAAHLVLLLLLPLFLLLPFWLLLFVLLLLLLLLLFALSLASRTMAKFVMSCPL